MNLVHDPKLSSPFRCQTCLLHTDGWCEMLIAVLFANLRLIFPYQFLFSVLACDGHSLAITSWVIAATPTCVLILICAARPCEHFAIYQCFPTSRLCVSVSD